jgi:hypothetical protein
LVDFLWWKGSTHVIAQIKIKRTDQNGLETKNQLKNEREKEKNAKNTSRTQRVILLSNPGGHKEDSGPPFPLEILVLTQIQGFVDLSHKHLRGEETLAMMKENANEGCEGDVGSHILFNRAITQFHFCTWI